MGRLTGFITVRSSGSARPARARASSSRQSRLSIAEAGNARQRTRSCSLARARGIGSSGASGAEGVGRPGSFRRRPVRGRRAGRLRVAGRPVRRRFAAVFHPSIFRAAPTPAQDVAAGVGAIGPLRTLLRAPSAPPSASCPPPCPARPPIPRRSPGGPGAAPPGSAAPPPAACCNVPRRRAHPRHRTADP